MGRVKPKRLARRRPRPGHVARIVVWRPDDTAVGTWRAVCKCGEWSPLPGGTVAEAAAWADAHDGQRVARETWWETEGAELAVGRVER